MPGRRWWIACWRRRPTANAGAATGSTWPASARVEGFERDKLREHSWRYRDYVVRSLNDDKPYPQFIKEQLAGDVLVPTSAAGIVATGFLVAGPWDEVGNTQQSSVMRQRVREEELEDMVSATAQTFLGLTVNCARCHNHKFDPITHKDYYRLKAALEGVRHGNRPLPAPALTALKAEVARLEKEVVGLEAEGRTRYCGPGSGRLRKNCRRPMARWSFESDARDSIGGLHGTLRGGAVIVNGRLRLNGKGASVRTLPLPRQLGVKTLEAWTTLATLGQRGGGVLSVQSKGGAAFDAIAFGKRQPASGSPAATSSGRTRDLAAPRGKRPDRRTWFIVAVVYAADKQHRPLPQCAVPFTGRLLHPLLGAPCASASPPGDGHILFGSAPHRSG